MTEGTMPYGVISCLGGGLHSLSAFLLLYFITQLKKHSESADLRQGSLLPHMALFLVSLPSYPENFIKIR